MDELPIEIHKIIHNYNASYLLEIPRWSKQNNKWRRRFSVCCYKCKKTAKKVALDHICQKCWNYKLILPCHNLLICWDCAH